MTLICGSETGLFWELALLWAKAAQGATSAAAVIARNANGMVVRSTDTPGPRSPRSTDPIQARR